MNSFDEIGVFIYDTCADPTVTHRQTVRLISHLFSVGNRVCRDSRIYPPLIGVIFDGQLFDKSLDLFKSFKVPIITTSESRPNDESNATNVFSVAPAVKYLSNASGHVISEGTQVAIHVFSCVR
ncbi:unnamed protein product [Medioppia subpectinata]|uniref:Uncharacterized protein n=1 Tax=Medioppia subpectinata TaxID=1979941 RepID=A0A7R9KSG1_9ACAR|nr:unnamed protein product [Medioppia subpectinata]CAG2109011.1 unnamed protein product [Medioppia subpectinata]